MADRQSAEQSQPGLQSLSTTAARKLDGAEHAGLLEPDQMAEEHQHQDGDADDGSGQVNCARPRLLINVNASRRPISIKPA